MLPQDQPVLLQKKSDDDRYDTLIGILLSFAMLAGVWHYAVKPKPTHTITKSLHVDTAAVTTPQAYATTATVKTPAVVINKPVIAAIEAPAPVVLTTLPQTVPAIKATHVVLQTPTPVIKPVKPKPVVISPPPIAIPKTVVVAPIAPPPPVIESKPAVVAPVITPAPVPPVIEPVDTKIIVRESIEFGNGSARLPPASTPRLLEIVELLKNDTRHLKIVGHTDNIGYPKDNHILSLKRAKAVMRFLVNSGVPAEHLTVEGAGADTPLDDNATEEGRKRNRRIEISE
jgi:outer membrane protein OmpA-like peptidoglycan-associated protein